MMRVERLRGIGGKQGAVAHAGATRVPFFDYEFLRALERSGSIGRRSGWMPPYLVCKEGARVLGALCLYLKTDSYGEYIFDWEWARAYQKYGLLTTPSWWPPCRSHPRRGPSFWWVLM